MTLPLNAEKVWQMTQTWDDWCRSDKHCVLMGLHHGSYWLSLGVQTSQLADSLYAEKRQSVMDSVTSWWKPKDLKWEDRFVIIQEVIYKMFSLEKRGLSLKYLRAWAATEALTKAAFIHRSTLSRRQRLSSFLTFWQSHVCSLYFH